MRFNAAWKKIRKQFMLLAKGNASILKAWILSYTAILLLFTALFILFYYTYNKILVSRVAVYNQIFEETVSNNILTLFEENAKIIDYATSSATLHRAMLISGIEGGKDYYSLNQLRNEIAGYKDAFDIRRNFYVHLNNIGMIVSDREIASTREYFNMHYADKNIRYTQWLSKIKYGPESYSTLSDEGKRFNYTFYISLLPIGAKYYKNAGIIVDVDNAIVQEVLEEKISFDFEYLVLNDSGGIILRSDNLTADDIKALYGAANNGVIHLTSGKYHVSINRNGPTGFNFLCLLPYAQVTGHFQLIINTGYFVILLIFIAGVYLIIKNVNKSYTPIKSLVSAVSEKGVKERQGDGQNEFDFIKNVFEYMRDDRKTIQNILERQKNNLRSNYLARFMKYAIEDDLSENPHDIHFIGNRFAVLLYYIESFEEFIGESEEIDDEEKYKTIVFIVKNLAEEYAQSVGAMGYLVEVDGSIALLVNVGNGDDPEKQVMQIADFTQEFFESNLNIIFTVAASNVYKDATGIYAAYHEALTLLEYRAILWDKSVITYKETAVAREGEGHYHYYTLQKEQELMIHIKNGDFDGARSIVDSLFQQIFGGAAITLEQSQCMAYDFINTLYKIKSGSGDEIPEVPQNLLSWKNTNELYEGLLVYLKELCLFFGGQENKRFKNIIMEYIEKHYSNPLLNVSMIADGLNFNRSYISTMFKEQTNTGILEYINMYRVEKAKRLLETTDDLLEDIAVSVGYRDSKALIRIFKKYNGVTPTQYRLSR